jgi:hypothetical protein
LIPDLCDKLPGKSVWLPADKALIVDILRKKDLKTYFGVSKIFSHNLVSIIEMILRKKILSSISMTKKIWGFGYRFGCDKNATNT